MGAQEDFPYKVEEIEHLLLCVLCVLSGFRGLCKLKQVKSVELFLAHSKCSINIPADFSIKLLLLINNFIFKVQESQSQNFWFLMRSQ